MRIIENTEEKFIFDLDKENYDGQTVGDLKRQLGELPYISLHPDEQCIRYDNVVLSDEMLLNDILGDKRQVFILTKASDNDWSEPSEEDGAVGGALPTAVASTVTMTSAAGTTAMADILRAPALTTQILRTGVHDSIGFVMPTIVPELDLSSDDEEPACIFDEEMELPSDLQDYYPRSLHVDEDLVMKIVDMGYTESDARQALLASFNHADRAIEYLIEGMPKSLGMGLPDSRDLTPSRTPPPSYTGSICSDLSRFTTPTDAHSPVLSNTSEYLTYGRRLFDSSPSNSPNVIHFTPSDNENEIEHPSVQALLYRDAHVHEHSNALTFELLQANGHEYENDRDGCDGYDGNDESEGPAVRIRRQKKRKLVSKFKRRRVAAWAAKASRATATAAAAAAAAAASAAATIENKKFDELTSKINSIHINGTERMQFSETSFDSAQCHNVTMPSLNSSDMKMEIDESPTHNADIATAGGDFYGLYKF